MIGHGKKIMINNDFVAENTTEKTHLITFWETFICGGNRLSVSKRTSYWTLYLGF